jgi:hypothetical protein
LVDWQSSLVPVIPAKTGIQAVFALELKTNLDAGVRRHDELSPEGEGEGHQDLSARNCLTCKPASSFRSVQRFLFPSSPHNVAGFCLQGKIVILVHCDIATVEESMKIDSDDFRIVEDKKLNLGKWPTAERLPDEALNEKTIWRERFRSIRHFEAHLHRNGTRIVKFFLHLSKEEQRKRFLARIDEPDKNWKFNETDVEERKYWNEYMKSYQACLSATSTADSPWYAVPADDKGNARLIISQVIVDTLQSLKMEYPKLAKEQRNKLQALRKLLAK